MRGGRETTPSLSLTCVVPMSSLAPSILLMLQAADSAGTRIVLEHTWLDTAAGVAQSLVSILVVVMLIVGVLLLYALKKSIDELSKLIKNAYEPLKSAIAEAREVTGEVRTLAKGLKAPVEKASETITEASERVRAAMDVAEGRLARLDALVDIAQEEAEGVVLGAASLLRGVKAGGRVVQRSFGLISGNARNEQPDDEESDDIDFEDEDEIVEEGDDEAETAPSRVASHEGSGEDEDEDENEEQIDDTDDADDTDGAARFAANGEAPTDSAFAETPRIRRRTRARR